MGNVNVTSNNVNHLHGFCWHPSYCWYQCRSQILVIPLDLRLAMDCVLCRWYHEGIIWGWWNVSKIVQACLWKEQFYIDAECWKAMFALHSWNSGCCALGSPHWHLHRRLPHWHHHWLPHLRDSLHGDGIQISCVYCQDLLSIWSIHVDTYLIWDIFFTMLGISCLPSISS